jgi:hypothetical protein
MAFRIHEQVLRGEIDNRVKGRVTGTIWLEGRGQPLILELKGNPWRDLAGHLLRFTNPDPKPGVPEGLAAVQQGQVGDITASRKVKVLDCSMDEFVEHYKNRTPFPWHWGNSLYLEWYSEANGRVVIESSDYALVLEGEAAWTMTAGEEEAQAVENEKAMEGFMGDMARMLELMPEEAEDQEIPDVEAEADDWDATLNLLFDRTDARLRAEGLEGDREAQDRIYEEERAKLRRERGEPEPEPLTPEQIAEQERWVAEMNAICEEAMKEAETHPPPEPEPHPLRAFAFELGLQIHREIEAGGWIPKGAPEEHPLHEVHYGVTFAAAKLAGALGHFEYGDREWPPDEWVAGDVLVRLKKARGFLRDAIAGLDAAEEQRLAPQEWISGIRPHVEHILSEVLRLIEEARGANS